MSIGNEINIVVKPTPPGVNPYVGPGLAGVPDVLSRIMETPEKLASTIDEVMFYRGMEREDVVKNSGLPIEIVNEVLDNGTGFVNDVLLVLETVGIRPVAIPGPPALRTVR